MINFWNTQIILTRHIHCRTYQVPKFKTDYRKESFFPRTINDWNNLPPDIVTAETLEIFKAKVAHFYEWLSFYIVNSITFKLGTELMYHDIHVHMIFGHAVENDCQIESPQIYVKNNNVKDPI